MLGYLCLGLPVRRLFSNFASGWPALGLLLIRIAAGASLIINGIMCLHAGHPVSPLIFGVLALLDGAMLVAGLWTPLAGIFAIAVSAGEMLVRHEDPYPGILLAAMGAGLALVGPGAFSIDAWIFGLKKIDLEKLDRSPVNDPQLKS